MVIKLNTVEKQRNYSDNNDNIINQLEKNA